MSNPFLEPRSILVEQERRRRERFRVSVYVGLGAMTVFLLGLLIQGCQRSDSAANPSGNLAEMSTPTNSVSAPESSPTNMVAVAGSKPETNLPVSATLTIPASNPPVVQPVAEVTPSAPAASQNPAPAATTAPGAKAVYVVKSGDTLTRIARNHHTTVQAIKTANNLKTDRILPGKKLKMPPATTPLATAASGI